MASITEWSGPHGFSLLDIFASGSYSATRARAAAVRYGALEPAVLAGACPNTFAGRRPHTQEPSLTRRRNRGDSNSCQSSDYSCLFHTQKLAGHFTPQAT